MPTYAKREPGLLIPAWVTETHLVDREKMDAIASIITRDTPTFQDSQGVSWQLVDVLPPTGVERPFVGVFRAYPSLHAESTPEAMEVTA